MGAAFVARCILSASLDESREAVCLLGIMAVTGLAAWLAAKRQKTLGGEVGV